MKRLTATLLCISLFSVTTVLAACNHVSARQAATEESGSSASERAASVVDAFHAALGRQDTTSALALLADDALIFESGYVERSKMEYADHHLASDAEFAAAVTSVLSKRSNVVNGDMAWIASEGHTTGRFNNKAIDQITTETMVLRRDASGWRIVHIHWSSRKA